MIFQINKDTLKKGISRLKNTLAKDSPRPIIKHFLFEIKDKILTVKSTNNAVSSVWTTSIEATEDFSFTVPGDTFTSLIATLEHDVVSFDYAPMSKDVTVTCGKYTWDASSGDVTEFPNIKVPEDLQEIVLPLDFQSLLKSVSFAISNDVTKMDLSSLCFDINKDKEGVVNLLSTDRLRLSCASFNAVIGSKEHIRFLIPRNSLSEVMKFEPTKIGFDKELRKAYFTQEDPTGVYTFQTVLSNTVYPDIYTYLNGAFSGESDPVQMQRHDLVRALKRTLITSDKNIGKFTFSKGKLFISTLNETNTSKSKEFLEAGYNLDTDVSFSVNVNHLLDYLSQEPLDTVSFKVVNGKCLVFDKDNYRHVLSVNP